VNRARKIRQRLDARGLAAFALPALVLCTLCALSAVPPARATSPGAPSASASISPSPALPAITGAEVPETPSPPPTAEEWKRARAVRPSRGDNGPCRFALVREWLEIRCIDIAGAGLVAGDPKGVSVQTTGNPVDETDEARKLQTRVTMPLRRGEARIVSFMRLVFEYNGSGPGEAGMLSIVWRNGHRDPVLVMNGVTTAIEP
jgi:hypothetical protein